MDTNHATAADSTLDLSWIYRSEAVPEDLADSHPATPESVADPGTFLRSMLRAMGPGFASPSHAAG
jgi:hypothetical protein